MARREFTNSLHFGRFLLFAPGPLRASCAAAYDVAIHVRAADAAATSAVELTEDVDIQRSHRLCDRSCLPTCDLSDVPVKYIVSFDNVDAVHCSLCGVSICE